MTRRNCIAVCVTILCLCAVSGCSGVAALRKPLAESGATVLPVADDPVVLVNIRVESSLKYFLSSGSVYYADSLHLKNVVTGERISHVFFRNTFIKGSFDAPLRVSEGATDRPVLLAVPAGQYAVDQMSLESYTLKGETLDPKESVPCITIPDEPFVSLGTLVIRLTEKEGVDVGNVLQGFKFANATKTIEVRPLSEEEAAFALEQYPVLQKDDL